MKKNIWTFYFLVLTISIVGFIAFAYNTFEAKQHELKTEQSSTLQLLQHTFQSSLIENELLLDILGNQLLENQNYLDQQKTHQLLKKMLDAKPELAGFGLTDTNGNFIATSSNINTSNLPNLKTNPNSQLEFQQTIQKNRLVVGKTNFFKPVNSWVIPLRKTLRDNEGKTVAVMTTGISLMNYQLFKKLSVTPENFIVFNPSNRHFLYIHNQIPGEYTRYYGQPLSESSQKIIDDALLKRYGVNHSDARIKMPNQLLTVKLAKHEFFDEGLFSIIYDPSYDLWLAISTPTKQTQLAYIEVVLSYLALFALIHLVIYLLVHYISRSEQITQRELSYNAEHDALTGLHNRHYLKNHFQALQNTTTKYKISLLFVDLDNFKYINDNFGHHIGDKLLEQVALRLKRFSTNSDATIRFGGDEFIILLLDSQETDYEISRQLIEELSVSYLVDDFDFNIGASVGIARADSQHTSLGTLLSQADLAMYAAKKRKNWVEIFNDRFLLESNKRAEVEHHLREAINNNEFSLVYQPQIDANGQIYGVESLIRWKSRALGHVSPADFIPMAEDIGVMPELGKYIFETALTEMSALQKKLQLAFQLSVNVSVKQFNHGYFYEDLIDLLEETEFPKELLTVEVTESLFIEELEPILNTLHRLKRQNISISLDDFGTGFSSLSLLRKLPITELKIDKSFIDDILLDSKDAAMIESMLNIAKKLGMHTVAEGVEQAEQVGKLTEYGCNFYQGYYFAKPMNIEKLEQFINETKQPAQQ